MVVESFVQIRVVNLFRLCWTFRKVVTSLVARFRSPDGYRVNIHGCEREYKLLERLQKLEIAVTSAVTRPLTNHNLDFLPCSSLGIQLNTLPSPDAHREPSNSKIHLYQPLLARTDNIISEPNFERSPTRALRLISRKHHDLQARKRFSCDLYRTIIWDSTTTSSP